MNIIDTILFVSVVSVPVGVMCIVAHCISTILGWNGLLYYVPFILLLILCIQYLKIELRRDEECTIQKQYK